METRADSDMNLWAKKRNPDDLIEKLVAVATREDWRIDNDPRKRFLKKVCLESKIDKSINLVRFQYQYHSIGCKASILLRQESPEKIVPEETTR